MQRGEGEPRNKEYLYLKIIGALILWLKVYSSVDEHGTQVLPRATWLMLQGSWVVAPVPLKLETHGLSTARSVPYGRI